MCGSDWPAFESTRETLLLRCLHLCAAPAASPQGETVLALVRALAGARPAGPQGDGPQPTTGPPASLVQRALTPADWAPALAAAGIPHRAAPYRSVLDLTTRRRIADELAVVRPDLLLLWGVEAARSVERPVRRALGSGEAARLGVVLGYEAVAPFAHAGVRRLVAPTQDLVDYARESGWPPDQIGLLPPVVPEPAVGPVLRQRWDTPEQVDLVAVPASDELGAALLLDAWRELPEAWLWLVPPPGREKRLRRELRRRGKQDPSLRERLRLVDRPELAVAAADLALVARADDPIGLPVIACWAAARATLALAAPGAAALIRHDRDGLLVAPDDPRALAASLERLLADPLQADRLAAAGRTVYEQGFAAAKATDRWHLTLEMLAGPPQVVRRGDAGTDIRV